MTTRMDNGQETLLNNGPSGRAGMASLVKWSDNVDAQLQDFWKWRRAQDITGSEKAVAAVELGRKLDAALARIDELESTARKVGTGFKVRVEPKSETEVYELPPGVVDNRRTTPGNLVYVQLCRIEAILRKAEAPMAYAEIGQLIDENGKSVSRIIAATIENGDTRFSRSKGSVALREFGYVDDPNRDGVKKAAGPS